jgi:hypothetical protein
MEKLNRDHPLSNDWSAINLALDLMEQELHRKHNVLRQYEGLHASMPKWEAERDALKGFSDRMRKMVFSLAKQKDGVVSYTKNKEWNKCEETLPRPLHDVLVYVHIKNAGEPEQYRKMVGYILSGDDWIIGGKRIGNNTMTPIAWQELPEDPDPFLEKPDATVDRTKGMLEEIDDIEERSEGISSEAFDFSQNFPYLPHTTREFIARKFDEYSSKKLTSDQVRELWLKVTPSNAVGGGHAINAINWLNDNGYLRNIINNSNV